MKSRVIARWLRRKLSPPVYIGRGTLLVRTVHGHFMYVPSEDVSLTPSIALEGSWEPQNTSLLRSLLRPGMHFVDIGAHCGWYSLLGAESVGSTGRVTAIEANPKLIGLLRRSAAANWLHDRIHCVHAAVLDHGGTTELGQPEEYSGSSSIHFRDADREARMEVWTVRSMPLSDCVADRPVDVIKIDAEGSEPLIWDGAASIFEKSPQLTILMEFAPELIEKTRPPSDFLAQIRGSGFRISAITSRGRAAQTTDEALLRSPLTEVLIRRP